MWNIDSITGPSGTLRHSTEISYTFFDTPRCMRRPVDDNENGQSEAKVKMDEWDERVGWDWSEYTEMQHQSSKGIGVFQRIRSG
jgi:hypothetical protein